MLCAIQSAYGIAREFSVCAHTIFGGYMEFFTLEKLASESNARMVADSYAETWRKRKSENVKSICVRKGGCIVYEVAL